MFAAATSTSDPPHPLNVFLVPSITSDPISPALRRDETRLCEMQSDCPAGLGAAEQ